MIEYQTIGIYKERCGYFAWCNIQMRNKMRNKFYTFCLGLNGKWQQYDIKFKGTKIFMNKTSFKKRSDAEEALKKWVEKHFVKITAKKMLGVFTFDSECFSECV